MPTLTTNPLEQFHWTPQPAAEQLVRDIVDRILKNNPQASRLCDAMRDEAGVRFVDCIDHLIVAKNLLTPQQLNDVGFQPSELLGGCYVHPGGIFPQIILNDRKIPA